MPCGASEEERYIEKIKTPTVAPLYYVPTIQVRTS
jgi:hypothetical protein